MSETKGLTQSQLTMLEQRLRFAQAKTLEDAFEKAGCGIGLHRRFVHYTTLSRLLQIIMSGRWWLTRSNAVQLNDVQEARKYGNSEILGRMYQASFGYGTAESAAMWGLYCPGNPLGVMISLDGDAMIDWFGKIREKNGAFSLEYGKATGRHGRQLELENRQIDEADARDVIYAATGFSPAAQYKGDKNRCNTLFWFDVFTTKIENLEREIKGDKFSGWMKDLEWRQENESRIAVRVKNVNGALPDHLSISVTDPVLKSMRITLSPWLREEYYAEVENVVRALFMTIHNGKLPRELVARSNLTGALEAWRERYCGAIEHLKTICGAGKAVRGKKGK